MVSTGRKSPEQSKPKSRVLHIAPLPPPTGGMVTYALGLLSCKASNVFDFRAISFYQVRKDRQEGILRKLLNVINAVLLTFSLLKNLIIWRPAIVHVQTNSGSGFYEKSFYMLLARMFFRKTVLHVHGGGFRDFYGRAGRFAKWVIRKFATMNNRLIVASPAMRETFLTIGVPDEKIILIRNAIASPENGKWDNSKASGPAEQDRGRIRLLFLNRVTIEKGVLDLIDAVDRIRTSHHQVYLRIVGMESPDCGRIAQHIENLGLSESVTMVGPVFEEQKDAEYRAADIYVLPSHIEDLPYGLLEAMSYGLPCIASAVGGIPSLVEDGVNGLLIEPKDINGLVSAIDKLVVDPGLHCDMGTRARRTIETGFSWGRSGEQIVQVYDDLLKS